MKFNEGSIVIDLKFQNVPFHFCKFKFLDCVVLLN